MVSKLCAVLFCTAITASAAPAETFVIESAASGHEATVKIPAGAVATLSANSAELLVDYANTRVEAMRLRGDVSISITGSDQLIQIKAESLVLELLPDQAVLHPGRRADAAANNLMRSTTRLRGSDGSHVFVGNVVFDLQTPSGPMQIRADRVEHQLRRIEPAPEAGA